MILSLSARQATWLFNNLSHFGPNTVQLRQREPYGPLEVRIYEPSGIYGFRISAAADEPVVHLTSQEVSA